MPPAARILSALVSTRRGVLLLAVVFGTLYVLFVYAPSSAALVGAGSGEGGVQERLRQSWASWRAAGGEEEVDGGKGGAGQVRQAAQHTAKEWFVAPERDRSAGGTEGGSREEQDDMFVHENERSSSSSDPSDEDGDERARADPNEANERLPRPKEKGKQARPFGKDVPLPQRKPQAGTNPLDGLLSSDELQSLDAEAEQRLASSHSHSSHDPSSPSPDESLTEHSSSSPSRPNDEDYDYDAAWSGAADEEEGAPDEDYSPEEAAEADAPSLAAQDDAALRAPMAALSGAGGAKKGEEGDEGADEKARAGGGGSGGHAAAKLPGQGSEADVDAMGAKKPAPPPPPPPAAVPAKPAKKVGTGGKLLAGAGANGGVTGDDGVKKPVQRVGAGEKAGAVVQAEAGRRVGTGARPGAKGMRVPKVERRRR
ncbi:hypothetical protein JCM10213_007390 [Rhodosporidiobolus nylandii]